MSHRLQILIPDATERRLRKAAQRERVSVAEWVRRVIDGALAGDRKVPDPLDKLASLGGPTGDIEQVLAEIEAGRT